MTVASSTDRATFAGNGTATVFSLPFRFFANSEIQAYLVTNATGALTLLTIGTHYTLIGAGDPEVAGNPTSKLTMITAPTSLQSLFVLRVIPITQPTDIVNQGRFFPEIHENAFDRMTMLIQQANGESKGAIRVAVGDPDPSRLPNAIARANLLLSFDAFGNPIAVAPSNGSSADLALRLADVSDPLKGAGIPAFAWSTVYPASTAGGALQQVSRNIRKFGAIADNGATNDLATFQAAAAAGPGIIDARGLSNCLLDGVVSIGANQTWLLTGSKFKIVGTVNAAFSAINVDGWELVGPFKIVGDLVTNPGLGVTAAGIKVSNCADWRITHPTVSLVRGTGIEVVPGANTRARGRGGVIESPTLAECVWGWKDAPGSGAEYCTVNNIRAVGNAEAGVQTAAGNTNFNGGHVVDNINDGVQMLGGSNNAHGEFTGLNINHNNRYNLHANGVSNGETFNGCHFYANGVSGQGAIYLQNSRGIHIKDGAVDCWIYNDTGAGSGMNVIEGNYFPGDYGVTLTTTNAGLHELSVARNMAPTGLSVLNEASFLSILVNRSSSQSLTAGSPVVLIFNTENTDNRKVYDNTTGVYTVPAWAVGQQHTVDLAITITADSGLAAGGYVEVRSNAAVVGYIPIVAVSGTLALATGRIPFVPSGAHAVDVRAVANSGSVTPVLSNSVSKMAISLG